jgi:hypothetical protein
LSTIQRRDEFSLGSITSKLGEASMTGIAKRLGLIAAASIFVTAPVSNQPSSTSLITA